MARFEDTPGMFGKGVGGGTGYEITCSVCRTVHNKGIFPESDPIGHETVCYQDFAGLTVCDCCFEEIEETVWLLLGDIFSWATRRLRNIDLRVQNMSELLRVWRQTIDDFDPER